MSMDSMECVRVRLEMGLFSEALFRSKKIYKIFQILHHIEYLNTYTKH
jgi:hypothetical protein